MRNRSEDSVMKKLLETASQLIVAGLQNEAAVPMPSLKVAVPEPPKVVTTAGKKQRRKEEEKKKQFETLNSIHKILEVE